MKNSRLPPAAASDWPDSALFAGYHPGERETVSAAEGLRIVSLMSIAGWLAILIAARWLLH